MNKVFVLFAAFLILAISGARAERIKDIAHVGGVRSNQLVGYGLVVGLDGSGDGNGAIFTAQSVANMLEKFGVTVPAGALKVKNVAAVMVTCRLPAFAKNGSGLDVTVSSLGDARSLQGGMLLQTPLRGADGAVYAVAQGAVSVGGFSAAGGGSSQTKNHVTAGRVPAGALVEREVPTTLTGGGQNTLAITLERADFTTAARIAEAVRTARIGLVARAVDAGTVEVSALETDVRLDAVGTIAQIEGLSVTSDEAARVVVNERTGTVVVGANVSLSPCAIAHGNLQVKIRARPDVAQPAPLSNGRTVVTPNTKIAVREDGGRVQTVSASATVEQVVRSLNALGVTPRDLIAILQALKAAGALKAELEIL